MKYKTFWALVVATAIALALMVSCTPTKQEEQELSLQIGVMSSMDYLPLAVAQEEGYFTDEGVTVVLQKFFSANDRDAAIQGKQLDGTILDYTGGAIQRAGGVPLRFVSQCDGTFELIAGTHTGVTELGEQLEGKNFATARNTVIDFCTDMVIQKEGIDLSKVTKSEINKIPLRLEMLKNKQIDLTVLPDPFASIARSEGHSSLVSLSELGYHVTGIAFTEEAITEKEQAIRAFYKAYNRAISDLLKRPVAEFAEILSKEVGFPEALAPQVQLPEYHLAQAPQTKDLEAVGTWLKERGLIPENFEMESIVDSSLLPQ